MNLNCGQTYALHRLHLSGPCPPKSEFESKIGASPGPGSAIALIDNAIGTWACFAISKKKLAKFQKTRKLPEVDGKA